mmetsp:Transcript_11862/g.17176  ORF Transcript_11862/g.17176 Transcript_11862/m.17176 type:complete len:132 (+) Transcript_11862:160-555(+)
MIVEIVLMIAVRGETIFIGAGTDLLTVGRGAGVEIDSGEGQGARQGGVTMMTAGEGVLTAGTTTAVVMMMGQDTEAFGRETDAARTVKASLGEIMIVEEEAGVDRDLLPEEGMARGEEDHAVPLLVVGVVV